MRLGSSQFAMFTVAQASRPQEQTLLWAVLDLDTR
jgi:hypothetical protein